MYLTCTFIQYIRRHRRKSTKTGPCASQVLQLLLVCTTTAEVTLGDRLFEGALKYANQSLHGRFISQMVDGSLPQAAFDYYLKQDNLYLSKYARAFGVLGAKAAGTEELAWLLNQSVGFLHEHGKKANSELQESTFEKEASVTTIAYTSFILESVWGDDMIMGYASVLPCQRLYDWLFATLNRTRHIAEDNPYKKFIEQYAAPINHAITLKMESFLEQYAAHGLSDEWLARAQFHYDTAMKYESQFFDQAIKHCEENGCEPALAEVPVSIQQAAENSRWSAVCLLPVGNSFCGLLDRDVAFAPSQMVGIDLKHSPHPCLRLH
ncbi:thiED [Symbiodinium microadriaticum]|nr:thiED [Symbiodinium microadriaticum]